jgi:polyphosphate kinase 2 (PPK2 family)
VTGFSETITGLNATGNLFTGNGSFIFEFEDLAGNTGSITATVSRIDKDGPEQVTLASPSDNRFTNT